MITFKCAYCKRKRPARKLSIESLRDAGTWNKIQVIRENAVELICTYCETPEETGPAAERWPSMAQYALVRHGWDIEPGMDRAKRDVLRLNY